MPTDPLLGQLRLAVKSHPLAFLVALPFGGFVPVSVWVLTHLETLHWWHWTMVAGGALFSSFTVIEWGKRILTNTPKAIGFAVLVEGVMITSATHWLSCFALGLLIVINGIGCAAALTREDQAVTQR